MNSGESPESSEVQRSSGATSETHETENRAQSPKRAAELAPRQGDDAEDDAVALWEQAARSSADGAIAFGLDPDGEDDATALWKQAARSSADVIAFGLDGAL